MFKPTFEKDRPLGWQPPVRPRQAAASEPLSSAKASQAAASGPLSLGSEWDASAEASAEEEVPAAKRRRKEAPVPRSRLSEPFCPLVSALAWLWMVWLASFGGHGSSTKSGAS